MSGLAARWTKLAAHMRPSYEGSPKWLWFVGMGRLCLLFVLSAGTQLSAQDTYLTLFLLLIYMGAGLCTVWYLLVLYRQNTVPPTLTWTQMLVDLSVVMAAVGWTGGPQSPFTFLFVLVILEAGFLMGYQHGLLFAGMSLVFSTLQALTWMWQVRDPFVMWYHVLIQNIGFLATAFISGYWNERVNRMKQFQRDILDNMNSGFLITDSKGLILAANRAACAILGLPEDSLTGRHVEGVIRPASGEECPVTTALRHQRDFVSYEFYVQCAGDRTKLLGLTTNILRDRDGKAIGVIASFTDLTEMAKMREELRRQDKLAALGELTANLAHEIRNPTTGISSSLEELQRQLHEVSTPQIAALLRLALRECRHLNEIVTRFLDFAREPTLEKRLVNIAQLIDEIAEEFAQRHPSGSPHRLAVHQEAAPCWIQGRRTEIKQVLDNLVQNAVEAMTNGGTVYLSLRETATFVELRVEDEGPGIPPDKIPRIFEPFYSEKPRGVGLGLSICHRIVTAHNGTIHIGARHGGGAAFVLRFPSAREAGNAAGEESCLAHANGA